MENKKADCARLMLNFRNVSAHDARTVPTSGRYSRAIRSQPSLRIDVIELGRADQAAEEIA